MKKALLLILAALVLITLASCSSESADNTEAQSENEVDPIEKSYEQLVDFAKTGNYFEGWRVYELNRASLENYKDAALYRNYCDAMRAYEAGALGEAYELLSKNATFFDSSDRMAVIESEIAFLNGIFKADNGKGSYIYLAFEKGKAASGVVGYYDDAQFEYTAEDFKYQLLKFTDDEGKCCFGLGSYNSSGAKITVNYVIDNVSDSTDIMIVASDGSEFTTLNGLYNKVS